MNSASTPLPPFGFKYLLSTGVFLTFAPRLHRFYASTMTKFLAHHTSRALSLSLPFINSVFACFSVNLGPRTVCYIHTDSKNLPFGWCALIALGRFNYRLGGHLILWDLKLILEFPPGCVILLPSAALRHGNTVVADNEHRYSFAMYTAGGLFRWVEQAFQSATSFWASLKNDPEAHSSAKKAESERWREGLAMFSTLEELERIYENIETRLI